MVQQRKRSWLWFMEDRSSALELQPLRWKSVSSKGGEVNKDEETTEASESSSDYYDFGPSTDLPKEVQLLRIENLAIPACYLVVGTMQGLVRPLLNVYPLDLGATEAQQTTLSMIATMPCAFKILYGFVSDNLPIAGYRRKPYMLVGWVVASSIMALLIWTSDLTLSHDMDNNEPIPPDGAPSMEWLMICFFIFGTGMWFADVMADSLVAQKAPLEPEAVRGSLQSSCYAARFFGIMVAATVSTAMYGLYGPRSVVISIMVIPFFLFPLIYWMAEERNLPIKATMDQCREIWRTACLRSVWQPMAFLYIFNVMQVSNAAWRQFLKTVLGFTPQQLNTILVFSYFCLYAGTMLYKYCFLKASWRTVYGLCMCLNAVFSALQLLLIRGKTLGLSPFVFALGDDAFAEFLQGVQFLPISIMMVALCPKGSEGASFAMFTTVWNSAMMLAPALSSLLLGIWDTSKEALEAGELDGLFNLSILTTVLQMLPVVFIHWLPHDREELAALAKKPYSGSRLGGGVFLTVLGLSMLWTLAVNLLNVFIPGWAGGS